MRLRPIAKISFLSLISNNNVCFYLNVNVKLLFIYNFQNTESFVTVSALYFSSSPLNMSSTSVHLRSVTLVARFNYE